MYDPQNRTGRPHLRGQAVPTRPGLTVGVGAAGVSASPISRLESRSVDQLRPQSLLLSGSSCKNSHIGLIKFCYLLS